MKRAPGSSFLAHFPLGCRNQGSHLGKRIGEMLTQILETSAVLYVFLSWFIFYLWLPFSCCCLNISRERGKSKVLGTGQEEVTVYVCAKEK